MSRTVSNSDNIIDSRDVIARLDELESEREDLDSALDDAKQAVDDAIEAYDDSEDKTAEDEEAVSDAKEAVATAEADLKAWDEDYEDELKALQALSEDAQNYCGDWRHGELLILDDHFDKYAQQFAEDIGAIGPDMTWPLNCIDWECAADELKQSYTSIDFDGETYWIRNS